MKKNILVLNIFFLGKKKVRDKKRTQKVKIMKVLSNNLIYSKKDLHINTPFKELSERQQEDFYLEQFRVKDIFIEIDFARLQKLRNKANRIKKL